MPERNGCTAEARPGSGAGEIGGGSDAPCRRGWRLGHSPPLDGIRGLAVLGVIAYHGGVGWANGGFLGVDAFFVLSGFLITALLVGEWQRRGNIRLRSFWARRARRLLPALFLMLAGIAAYGALLAPPDTLGRLRADALATLGYVANWHQIGSGQGYFAQMALPSPLLHTWSLAIEEQFYLVWPLVVLAALFGGRRNRKRSLHTLLGVAVAGAAASALEMSLLFSSSGSGRVYYGTDTRAQSLLIGAALAIGLTLWGRPEGVRGRAPRNAMLSLALGGGLFLAWSWSHVSGSSPWLYNGGFAVAALAVAALILCSVQIPGGSVAWALSWGPLRYVGRISYGLYLWHWPVFVIVDHARTGLLGWRLLALRLVLTFSFALLSYYLIEQPIRRGALRSWRAWVATPLAAATAAGLVVAGTVPALVDTASASALVHVRAPAPAAKLALGGSGLRATAIASSPPQTGPTRVLLVGDSVALTLGEGLMQVQGAYGAQVWDYGAVGCGVARGGPYNQAGVIGEPLTRCAYWPEAWSTYVDDVNPDVALVMIGRWEVLDRVHNGQWSHLGEPDFDAYVTQELDLAVQVLSERGARVVFLTVPYFQGVEQPDGSPYPQDDPHRVDVLNGLIRAVAAEHPDTVSVIDLNSMLDPGGQYTYAINGVPVRFSDGVHISNAGGAFVGQRILPQLVGLAEHRGEHLVSGGSGGLSPTSPPVPGATTTTLPPVWAPLPPGWPLLPVAPNSATTVSSTQ